MAYISKLHRGEQGRQRAQAEAIEGEFLPLNFDGEKFIQINTFGSAGRKERGKESQNIRLGREAFEQLVKLGSEHFKGQ
ncbi:MAG: hypothetical protein ACK4NZ_15635 [Tsuneonella sp.]